MFNIKLYRRSFVLIALCVVRIEGKPSHGPNIGYDRRIHGAKNIYVNSIPKCGTHLLTKCIELLTERPLIEPDSEPFGMWERKVTAPTYHNEFFTTHMPYFPKSKAIFRKHGFKTFLIYRDPRDKVISHVYWVYRGGWQNRLKDNPLQKLPFDKLVKHFIRRVKDLYNQFLPWMKESHCMPIRFENLIGPLGGGTQEAQIAEIKKIAQHINLPLNDTLINHCVENLFGKSPTFREGKIGSWKKHFTKEHKALFKREAGQLLIELGYEKDTKW